MSKINSLRFSPQCPIFQIAVLLAIYLIISIFLGMKTLGIPFFGEEKRERVVEHYAAYIHGYNAQRFGLGQSFGLADESTSQNEDGHPVVYLHGNILAPRLFTFLMFKLGIGSILIQTLVFIVGSAIWIPLGYLSFSRLFNPSVAFLSIFLIITDYTSTLINSINLFRGWHMVIFFFLLWTSVRLELRKRTYGQYFLLAVAVFVAVNYELPFAAFCLLISSYVIYRQSRSFNKTVALLFIPTAFALAVFATQVGLYLGGVRKLLSYVSTTFFYRIGWVDADTNFFDIYSTQRIIFWDTSANPVTTTSTFIFDTITRFINTNGLWLTIFVLFSNLLLIGWFSYVKFSETQKGKSFTIWTEALPRVYLIGIELMIFLVMPTITMILTTGTLPIHDTSLWVAATLVFLGTKLLLYFVTGLYLPTRFNQPGHTQLQKFIFFGAAILFLQTQLFLTLQHVGWITASPPPYLAFYEGALTLLPITILHGKRFQIPEQIQMSTLHINLASFILFSFGAVLLTVFIFPANLGFYSRNSYPLLTFFIYLSVPFSLKYLQPKLGISYIPLTFIFLVFWFSSQIQVYQANLPVPDNLIQTLQEEYAGASFGTTVPHTYQPIWYAVKSDVSIIDVNLSADRPADVPVFAYNRNFVYNDNGRPPRYIYLTRDEVLDISAYLLLNQDLLHKLFNDSPKIIDLEQGRYAIIEIEPK